MKKVFWLFVEVGFMVFIFKALVFTVSAAEDNLEFNEDISNYMEIHYLRDSGNSYDGYLDFDEHIYVNVENTLTPNGNEVEVYETFNDFSDTYIFAYNNYYDSLYPDAIRLSSATARYNCHSYAWYSQDINSNHYWMNDPSEYYDIEDMTYEVVNTPRIGDIICYFDDNGTPYNLTDDNNLHSGIIVDYDSSITINNVCGNSNQVTVLSKWGPAGLYQHMGDNCPYVSSHNGNADYVKYYRPRTNNAYTLTSSFNNTVTAYLNGNGTITDKYAMYELNANNWYYSFNISSDKQLDVRLYDEHMQLVNIAQTITGNYTNSFINQLLNGRYYLRVSYQNTSQSGTISTHISYHSHNYGAPYVWKNYNQHKSTCLCGETHQEPHAVSSTSFGGQQYATCLLCGGLASIGFIGPMAKGTLPTTINGSFILPNGVVVLVDTDIDSYLHNALIFYYPNVEFSRC